MEFSSSSSGTSSLEEDEDRERSTYLTPAQRDKWFKIYYDGDRYDTESFDDEVPLKSAHLKTSRTAPPGKDFRRPISTQDEMEEAKAQARREWEFGPDTMEGHYQTPFEDSFFFDQFLKDYLGGPIKRWKPIRSWRDKVEIEPLDTDVLPPLKPYKPILFEIESCSGKILTVQRVCGYREIMQKRARVQQLKWIELENRKQSVKVAAAAKTKKLIKRRRRVFKPVEIESREALEVSTSEDEGIQDIVSSKPPTVPKKTKVIDTSSLSSSVENINRQRPSTASSIDSYYNFFKETIQMHNQFQAILVGGGDKANDGKGNKGKPTDDKGKKDKPTDDKGKKDKPNAEKGKTDKPTDDKGKKDRPNAEKGKTDKPTDDKGKTAKPTDDKGKTDKPTDDKAKPGKPTDDKGKPGKPTDDKGKPDKPTDDKGKPGKPTDDKGKTDKPTDDKGKKDKPTDGKGSKGKVAASGDQKPPPEVSSLPQSGASSGIAVKGPLTPTGTGPPSSSEDFTIGESEADTSIPTTGVESTDEEAEENAGYADTSNAYDRDDEDEDEEPLTTADIVNVEDLQNLADAKDNEWLKLSSSDSEEIIFQYEILNKPKKKWMGPYTSYESENFARALKPFMIFISLFGRLPFFYRRDIDAGLTMFSVSRLQGFPFRFTSTILWIICVISAQSTVDIMFGSEDQEFRELESFEIQKFKVGIMSMFVNLSFVAVCSMAIMLKDNFHVCQYMNFMAASVTKMEISAIRRLGKTVVYNMLVTLVYCIIMITLFYYDFPKTVRGSSGFLAMVVCRPFLHRVRSHAHYNQIYFQVIGMCLHLYCYISLRFIFTQMHVLAVVIGNLAKNWNFRFGLCFAQFGTSQRAHTFRIHFGQSLIKLFANHRVISGLTHLYGSIFAIPIITYYILQIALVSSVLIIFFFEIYTSETEGVLVQVPGTNDSVLANTNFDSAVTSAFVLAHFILEFILVSEVISGACSSVMNSFEFVRRNGLLRCKNTHEVRLLMSLQWSMSDKNPALLNVNNFFFVNRPGVLASLGFSLVIVSLVIQLKQTTLATLILKCAAELTNIPPGYDFASCREVRLVSGNEAARVYQENEDLIGRLQIQAGAPAG